MRDETPSSGSCCSPECPPCPVAPTPTSHPGSTVRVTGGLAATLGGRPGDVLHPPLDGVASPTPGGRALDRPGEIVRPRIKRPRHRRPCCWRLETATVKQPGDQNRDRAGRAECRGAESLR